MASECRDCRSGIMRKAHLGVWNHWHPGGMVVVCMGDDWLTPESPNGTEEIPKRAKKAGE